MKLYVYKNISNLFHLDAYDNKQSYQLYDEAYQQHLAAPNTLTLAAYVELHNNYVQDVHAANAMADQFHNVILPQLIQVFRRYCYNIIVHI